MKYAVIIIVLLTLSVVGFMNTKKFGRSVRGERLARVEKSPNYRDGAFQNQEPTPQLTSDKSRVRSMIDFLFNKPEGTRPEEEIKVIKTDLKSLTTTQDLVVWFGHSSYFIQNSGKRILIDPVFAEAAPLSFLNSPFKGTDIYCADDMPDIDYLIITHDHWDHLDYKTVRDLRERVSKVICPLGVGENLEYWGFSDKQIVELDWNENSNLSDGFRIHCLPSRHFSGRTFKRNQTLWASYMIETPNKNIYLSGDGGYGTHFRKIAAQFPKIDIAIMENGQYNENWKYIHLMPDDLKSAIKELQPELVFAGHNGKFALARHTWQEPLNNAIEFTSDSINIIMPTIGEVVNLTDTATRPTDRWWES